MDIETYSPENGRRGISEGDTSKSQITDLDFAISISQDVLRLQISMENMRYKHNKQGAERR